MKLITELNEENMNKRMLVFNFACFMVSVFVMAFASPALAWVIAATALACNLVYDTERLF